MLMEIGDSQLLSETNLNNASFYETFGEMSSLVNSCQLPSTGRRISTIDMI